MISVEICITAIEIVFKGSILHDIHRDDLWSLHDVARGAILYDLIALDSLIHSDASF